MLAPGSWYQDLGTRILVPRSWYQDLGTKILVPHKKYFFCGVPRAGTSRAVPCQDLVDPCRAKYFRAVPL